MDKKLGKRAWFPLLLGLLATAGMAVGCEDSAGCAGGKACVCSGGSCDIECGGSGDSCSFECQNGATCSFSCPGGSCRMRCSEGASCTLRCPGGNCGADCGGAERCTITECTTACGLNCQGARTCENSCTPMEGGCGKTP